MRTPQPATKEVDGLSKPRRRKATGVLKASHYEVPAEAMAGPSKPRLSAKVQSKGKGKGCPQAENVAPLDDEHEEEREPGTYLSRAALTTRSRPLQSINETCLPSHTHQAPRTCAHIMLHIAQPYIPFIWVLCDTAIPRLSV
jgi:hypothetical protein